MQTFLPISTSFKASAEVLDNKRLNKQALEGWQILMHLLELDPDGNHRVPKGYINHPAIKMWRGYEFALYQYVQQMVMEWKRRGFKSTIGEKVSNTFLQAKNLNLISGVHRYPEWMVDVELYKEICASHRKALLSKHYEWYAEFEWPEDRGVRPTDYAYVWPV